MDFDFCDTNPLNILERGFRAAKLPWSKIYFSTRSGLLNDEGIQESGRQPRSHVGLRSMFASIQKHSISLWAVLKKFN